MDVAFHLFPAPTDFLRIPGNDAVVVYFVIIPALERVRRHAGSRIGI